MYLKKNTFTTLLVICSFCTFCCSEASATYCSLDRMKKIAMEACEHLFNFETEVRERRSLDYGFKRKHDSLSKQPSKHYINVRRSIYPPGGYLKVSLEHYNKLSNLDVSPPYKSKKITHIMNEKKMRNKREDKGYHNYSNDFEYCCFHKCDEEFFC